MKVDSQNQQFNNLTFRNTMRKYLYIHTVFGSYEYQYPR